MRKQVILTALAMLFVTSIFAQSTASSSIELIDTNTVFKVQDAHIWGIDKSITPNRFFYSFIHKDGAIQAVRGSLMSGGKELKDLPAYGTVELEGETIDPTSNKIQWVSPEGVGKNVNFLARPLTNAARFSGENTIARKGQIITDRTFENKLEVVESSAPLHKFPEKEESEPYYTEHYKMTTIGMALSGKISYLSLANYTLLPKEERFKGLFGTAYDLKAETNKDYIKTAFGDDTSISFKYLSGIQQIFDPISGNASIFSGIKYKKNKAKENSHFYEFMLITFNPEGELVNRVKYESEIPLTIDKVYPIKGENLGPGLDQVTHAIFLARGSGNKNTPNRNSKIHRIFVVDMLTGEIVVEDEMEFAEIRAIIVKARYLEGNKIALTYYYPVKDRHGLVEIIISKDGIENVKEIAGDSPEYKAIDLPAKPYSSLNLSPIYTFDLDDGGTITVEHFYTQQKPSSGGGLIQTPQAYSLMKYDAEGRLIALHGIGQLIKGSSPNVIRVTDETITMITYLATDNSKIRIKILTISKADFSIKSIEIPKGEFLADSKNYHYDSDTGILYFLTQKHATKGLSLFQFKL